MKTVEKIDVSQWKKFHLYDDGLFNIDMGTKLNKSNMSEEHPTVIFVGRSAVNNGIIDFVDLYNDIIPYEAGNLALSLGGSVGACFVQPKQFYTSQNVVVLKPQWKMPDNVKWFLASVIFKESSLHYQAFQNELNRHIKRDFVMTLPVTPAGTPDWDYMASYMSNVVAQAKTSLGKLRQADYGKQKIDIEDWKEFRIGELFEIKKGKRLTKAKMKPGKTRFIGSSATNNGCTALIGNTDNINPAGLITVCYNGSVGSTFYQNEPFIASDDVNILIPKFKMNKSIAFFIIPLIKAASYRYDYIDKWTKEIMANDIIKLPVTNQGDPDFIYMENYTKNIFNHTERCFNILKLI